MRRAASQFGGGGIPPAGPVTKGLLILAVGASIANGLFNFVEHVIFLPSLIFSGEVWRVVTYPWVTLPGDGAGTLFFILNCMVIYMFGAQLELQWGRGRYIRNLSLFVLVPALATLLIAVVVPTMSTRALSIGLAPMTYGLVAAYASLNRHNRFFLFPIPFEVSGDGLLIFDAACLALAVLMQFSQVGIGPHLTSIAALGLAVVWFRLDVARDLRRVWLRLRQRQIENRLAKARARRTLRVVSSDDDDDGEEPRRFLH